MTKRSALALLIGIVVGIVLTAIVSLVGFWWPFQRILDADIASQHLANRNMEARHLQLIDMVIQEAKPGGDLDKLRALAQERRAGTLEIIRAEDEALKALGKIPPPPPASTEPK